ncbi:MAG TPA: hypothetical protein DCY75_09750, partial [Clostridiales bacterium]|nr:hypothetical protein [Clostridiales bacterium]
VKGFKKYFILLSSLLVVCMIAFAVLSNVQLKQFENIHYTEGSVVMIEEISYQYYPDLYEYPWCIVNESDEKIANWIVEKNGENVKYGI